MAVTDNRTHFQDCEDAATHIAGQSTMGVTTDSTLSGVVLEGTSALGFQCDDAQEYFTYDQNSAGGTINLDMSDMTIYENVKHNLGETFANLGGQIVLCDEADAGGGDVIGYNVNGSDVPGFPYQFRYAAIKLDVSVVVASPGTDDVDYYTYSGTEAGLDHTSINQIGYGEFNIVKAVSSALNAWMDGIYYIANDSYAVSIEGGTSGTPETMTDVVGDDIAVGMGLFNNPKGSEFGFFGPTEWGDGAAGDTYFTSTGEQWYFIGDNQGGHTIGVTHFPFQLNGVSGSTNSWVLVSTVIVNTGTLCQFDMSDTDMDTATMEGCSLIGLGAIELPNAGTAKTTLACIFSGCGIVTSNGGDMTASSILTPAISANEAGLVWDLNQDPNGELDDMVFTKTSGTAHHAIEFGTSIPTTSITLTGIAFGTDFSASENTSPTAEAGDETFAFRDTTGTLTVNLVGCTGNFGFYSAGVVITKIVDPVAVGLSNVTEGTPVTIIAAETVGTITDGDVLLQAFADSSGEVSLSFDYEGAFDPSGLDVKVRARNQGVAVAAIAEDGGAFVDETDEAHSNTTADMTLLPAVPVASDAYNFGHSEQFNRLKLDISTVLTQSSAPTFAFEYWNGAWVALSGVVDGTSGYENSGQNIISWTMPGDWATTTINSQGPLYYMRIRITAIGTITQVPVGARVQLDVTRYLPYLGDRVITSDGLADVASWAVDSISKFDPND